MIAAPLHRLFVGRIACKLRRTAHIFCIQHSNLLDYKMYCKTVFVEINYNVCYTNDN